MEVYPWAVFTPAEIIAMILLVVAVAVIIYLIPHLASSVGLLRIGMGGELKRVRICPHCKGSRITLFMGGYLGKIYRCPDCGYQGPVTIELEKAKES